MRKPPDFDPPGLDDPQNSSQLTQLRYYELLTPLFGGGVKPGEVDEKFPIRGSTVRGQLRFWWRATCGGRFNSNLIAMKEAEDNIWGSTQHQSLVSVVITKWTSGSRFPAQDRYGTSINDVGHPSSIDGYAAFPLRESQENEAGEVREGISFTLRLSFPLEIAEDVRTTLWAWDTFGGVGARTRRGFGALFCCRDVEQVSGDLEGVWRWVYDRAEVADSLERDVVQFVSNGSFPDGVPHLSRDMRRYQVARGATGDSSISVWRALIDSLNKFRQSRSPGTKFPGRSHWPEPDAIRHLTNQPNPLPPERLPIYTPRIDKFPRAVFGLPIIFEFKNDRAANYQEPWRTTLEGANHSRLASPLILRPLALANGGYVGLGVVLEGPRVPPGGLVLKDAPPHTTRPDPDLDPSEASAIQQRHPTYDGNIDILQAFLNQL